MIIAYFSNVSNNTARLVHKTGLGGVRIPYRRSVAMPIIDEDYVLITPTYELKDGVPHQVRSFLSINHTPVGIIATGNRNFAGNFGIAGKVLSQELQVPELLPPSELFEDYENIKRKVSELSDSILLGA